MAITLGSFTLPPTLVWEDELPWSPVEQTVERSLTGALIVQEAVKTTGRPITLTGYSDGDQHTGGISRADLIALREALIVPGASWTLTLHDSRTFTVIARADPLEAAPLPALASIPPAYPQADHWYLIRALKLQTA